MAKSLSTQETNIGNFLPFEYPETMGDFNEEYDLVFVRTGKLWSSERLLFAIIPGN